MPDVDVKGKSPDANIDIKGPSVDLDVEGKGIDVDADIPKAKIDVPSPDVKVKGGIDVDKPDVDFDGDKDGGGKFGFDFKMPKFGFGGKKAPAATKAWQARAGYEAARCAEVQIGLTKGKGKEMHLLNAKKYYKYVVEQHPKSEFTAKAVKRLEVLSRL